MKHSFTFSSNAMRLGWKEWVIVVIILLGMLHFIPVFWEKVEKFNPSSDYRLPYVLSNDYWMFARLCKAYSSKYPVFVIGDSVIWGQYVKMDQTLTHYLNKMVEKDIFANAGVDGLHPVAMYGLIKYYGKEIHNKGVILHLNPLWLSSKKVDLSGDEEFNFNHPKLVPLLFPRIRCYKPSLQKRISTIGERYITFFRLVTHIKITYFNGESIQKWTVENPYKNPLKSITLKIPIPENKPKSKPLPWFERGIKKQDYPWVKLDESFQWMFFRKTIKMLELRNNRVFVIVGPFNPYILTERSLNRYKIIKNKMEKWLIENGVSFYSVPSLPSKYYADASHPLNEGYKEIAQHLCKNPSFKKWLRDLGI